jgi:hypothetical protein
MRKPCSRETHCTCGETPTPPIRLSAWPDLDFATLDITDLLRTVETIDPDTLTARGHLAVVAACEFLQRHMSAVQAASTCYFVRHAGPREGAFDKIKGAEAAAAELAIMKAVTTAQGGHQAATADDLCTNLPAILDLVRTGKLDLPRAVLISTLMHQNLQVGSWEWDAVAAAIAHFAPGLTIGRLRNAVLRALLGTDPDAAKKRHQSAKDRRAVYVGPLPDGMGEVSATLTADQVQIIDAVLDALADACRDHNFTVGTPDERSHQQRRADALAAVFAAINTGTPVPLIPASNPATVPNSDRTPNQGENNYFSGEFQAADTPDTSKAPESSATTVVPVPAAAGCPPPGRVLGWWLPPALPTQQGRRPHLVVTIAQSTLDGDDEMPAHLNGYGAIPACLARDIAAHAVHHATVIIPTGTHPSESPASTTGSSQPSPTKRQKNSPKDQPKTSGRTWTFGGHGPGDQAKCPNAGRPYKPRPTVIDEVVGLHQTCRFPHCEHPAERCDLDHVIDYKNGGTTCPCNLEPLCRRHHRLKTHGGWRVRFSTRSQRYPAGTVHWTSPCGQQAHEPPRELPGCNAWRPAPGAPPTPPHTPTINLNASGTPDHATPRQRHERRQQCWDADLNQQDPETRRPSAHKRSTPADTGRGEPPF